MTLPLMLYFLVALISGGITAGLAIGVFAVYNNPISERFLKFFGLLASYLVMMPVGYLAFGKDFQSNDVQIAVHVVYFLIYSLWTPVISDIFYEFRQKPNKGFAKKLSWLIAVLGMLSAMIILMLPLQAQEKIQLQRLILNGGLLPIFLVYLLTQMVISLRSLGNITDPWKKRTLQGLILLLAISFPVFFIDMGTSLFQTSMFQLSGFFFIGASVYFGAAWLRLLREAGWRYRGENLEPNKELMDARELSAREVDVVRLLFGEYSNSEISARLDISLGTVKNHIYHIFQKTGASSRRELLRMLT